MTDAQRITGISPGVGLDVAGGEPVPIVFFTLYTADGAEHRFTSPPAETTTLALSLLEAVDSRIAAAARAALEVRDRLDGGPVGDYYRQLEKDARQLVRYLDAHPGGLSPRCGRCGELFERGALVKPEAGLGLVHRAGCDFGQGSHD